MLAGRWTAPNKADKLPAPLGLPAWPQSTALMSCLSPSHLRLGLFILRSDISLGAEDRMMCLRTKCQVPCPAQSERLGE